MQNPLGKTEPLLIALSSAPSLGYAMTVALSSAALEEGVGILSRV